MAELVDEFLGFSEGFAAGEPHLSNPSNTMSGRIFSAGAIDSKKEEAFLFSHFVGHKDESLPTIFVEFGFGIVWS